MKKLIAILLFLSCFFGAMAQTTVTLTLNDATTQEIAVSEAGKIYFTDNQMIVDDGTLLPFTFYIENIRNVVFTAPVNVEEMIVNEMKVYPNPVVNELFFSCNDFSNHSFTLFSIDGRQVLSGTIQNGKALNMRKLQSGLYILKIDNSSFKINKL